QVADDAALVAVVGLKVWRIEIALVTAIGISLRAFDLDDVGAQIRKHHPGARTGDEGSLLNDADATKDLDRAHVRAIGSVRLDPARAFARHEPLRRIAVVANRRSTGVREYKADGTFLLFQEVRDEARRPGEDRHALHGQERIARVEQHRANRTGNVHHQRLAQDLRHEVLHRPGDLDV